MLLLVVRCPGSGADRVNFHKELDRKQPGVWGGGCVPLTQTGPRAILYHVPTCPVCSPGGGGNHRLGAGWGFPGRVGEQWYVNSVLHIPLSVLWLLFSAVLLNCLHLNP